MGVGSVALSVVTLIPLSISKIMSENATSYEDEGTLHNDQASKSLDVGQEDSNSQALCLEVLDMSNHGQPLGASSQDPSIDLPPRAQKMAKLLRDKRGSRAPVMEKMGTLQLLDLPMDILKEIVKEVCILDVQI